MIDDILAFLGRIARAAFAELLNYNPLMGTRLERFFNYAVVIGRAGIIGYLMLTRTLYTALPASSYPP
jgi:hypothetical protein